MTGDKLAIDETMQETEFSLYNESSESLFTRQFILITAKSTMVRVLTNQLVLKRLGKKQSLRDSKEPFLILEKMARAVDNFEAGG